MLLSWQLRLQITPLRIQVNKRSKVLKIASKISLKKIPKIIDQIKKIQKDVILVGFKAETNLSKKALITIAKKKLDESNADMIIANDIGSSRYKKNPNNNEVLIVDSKKVRSSGWKNKQKIAKFILKEIENKLK
jgi:phosphopantothenoylcysteine decarboxylase/phosphopantothenate--cysteine ligase